MVKVKNGPIPGLCCGNRDHNVRPHAASYQKLVREQIVAILCTDNSQSSDQ